MHLLKSILVLLASSGLAYSAKSDKPRFLTEKTKKFAVDGKKLPKVPFDIGESYAGHLPVSNDANEKKKLFFWYFPSEDADVKDEVAIWINGLGCSSISDAMTQHGPFTWMDGTVAPVKNRYSWHNLTNVVYAEAPWDVGEGINANNMTELARQFKGFWKNFIDTFNMPNYQIFLNGQRDGGKYIPYIADSFLNSTKTYYDVKGITLNSPLIGDSLLQQEYPMVPFFNKWSSLMGIDEATMREINDLYNKGPQPAYFAKYFTFPPPQTPFPSPPLYREYFAQTSQSSRNVNPCFNSDNVAMRCPFKETHWGYMDNNDPYEDGSENWFRRKDVMEALHFQPDYWWGCDFKEFFLYPRPGYDGTLGRVIDKTKNVIIGSGILNYRHFTNGTLFTVQNLTWGGSRGFSKYPSTPLFIPEHWNPDRLSSGSHGNVGSWVAERGLTFFTANWAGARLYGDAPTVGYRMIQQILGHITNFSSTAPLF